MLSLRASCYRLSSLSRRRNFGSDTTNRIRLIQNNTGVIVCDSYEATERIGAELARKTGLFPGTCVLLFGPVGAGKSVFARGFIRQLVGDPQLKVQSPTFLLEQEYVVPGSKTLVHHFDLYRFNPEMTEIDAKALDWRGSLRNGVCLVEWPERIRRVELLPDKWIQVNIAFGAQLDDHREISIEEKNKS